MFEQSLLTCPNCGQNIRQRVEDGTAIECRACHASYEAMVDEERDHLALVDVRTYHAPEPLFLPKGSIRASVTIALAATSWILILSQRHVPACLFNLLLAVIGYYFGFRTKVKSAESRIYDPTQKQEPPLFLPAGLIRRFLIAGFLVCAVVLWNRGTLGQMPYLEFFVVLSGLVVGHLLARLTKSITDTPLGAAVNHGKGLVVLGAALVLVLIALAGGPASYARLPLVLAAVISFYFGSRS